jgi:hypothetical protein
LEFALPKDGYLILPYSGDEFLNYGSAVSVKLPTFVDGATADVWDPATEVCPQEQFKDYTGVDSLSAFLGSILMHLTVYFIERKLGRPLFNLPLMEPYQKKVTEDPDEVVKNDETTKTRMTMDGNGEKVDGGSDESDEVDTPTKEEVSS